MPSHINLSQTESEVLDFFNLFRFASYNCVLSGVWHCQTFLGSNLQRQQAAGFSHLFYGLFGEFFLVLQECCAKTNIVIKQQTGSCLLI